MGSLSGSSVKEGEGEEIVGDMEESWDGGDGAGASRERGEGAAELTRVISKLERNYSQYKCV